MNKQACTKEHSPSDPCDCMDLPEGKTCGDCAHIKRCVLMFDGEPENTSCDWAPSRFREKVGESA